MNTYSPTLEQVLSARERRQSLQTELISKYALPVCCFTMNIAGPIKRTPLSDYAFFDGLKALKAVGECAYSLVRDTHAGMEAYFVFRADARALKEQTTLIENTHPAGRLFDMDVIDVNGEKLSRNAQRECIVCSGPVFACSRSRAHGLSEVQAATQKLLLDFAANSIALRAHGALIAEVNTTPKPGLVDLDNSGAHTDMGAASFVRSADALRGYFEECVRAGYAMHSVGVQELAVHLKRCGVEAEKAMYAATGGVNTHKGLIYSLGLLLGASGLMLAGADGELTKLAMTIAQEIENERDPAEEKKTNGEQVRIAHGLTGARGEAALGFPTARYALERLKEHREDTDCDNTALVFTLIDIMARLYDTNAAHRGGMEGLMYVQTRAREISLCEKENRIQEIRRFDSELIKRNISPGGAADMLATAIFLEAMER